MKKLILAGALVTGLVASQVPAQAGDAWVGPLIGGLFAGAILNEMSHPHGHYYQQPMYGDDMDYDYYQPQPRLHRVCFRISTYDSWGRYVGDRVQCRWQQ